MLFVAGLAVGAFLVLAGVVFGAAATGAKKTEDAQ